MGWMKRDPIELGFSSDLGRVLGGLRAKVLGCPKPELLQAARADVLPSDQANEINRHLEKCSVCKALLADLEALDGLELGRAGRQRIWNQIRAGMPEQAAEAARFGWMRPLPLAGAFAALILLVTGMVLMRNRQAPTAITVETHPPASVSTEPSVFRLEKAPVILPASAAILWRGQEDASAQPANDLKRALAPYESGDYTEAAGRLVALRKKYPRMAEASFYLGVCQLFLTQDEQATKTLRDAVKLASPPLKNQATWYLALADYRIGKPDLASGLLNQLCQAGGTDSGRACAGIKELERRH